VTVPLKVTQMNVAPIIEPLKPLPLKAALAAFMGVPMDAISMEHEAGSLRKAVARAIRTYREFELGSDK
jgi:hypothetical protein